MSSEGLGSVAQPGSAPGPAPASGVSPAIRDDQAGVLQTYTMGQPRTTLSHVVGSTSMFMHIVNTIVAGTLGALIASAAGGGAAVVTIVGSSAGLAYLAVMLELGRRSFRNQVIESRFPGSPIA